MKKKKKSEYTEKLLITNFLKNCKRDFFFFLAGVKETLINLKIAIANMNAWF